MELRYYIKFRNVFLFVIFLLISVFFFLLWRFVYHPRAYVHSIALDRSFGWVSAHSCCSWLFIAFYLLVLIFIWVVCSPASFSRCFAFRLYFVYRHYDVFCGRNCCRCCRRHHLVVIRISATKSVFMIEQLCLLTLGVRNKKFGPNNNKPFIHLFVCIKFCVNFISVLFTVVSLGGRFFLSSHCI